MYIHRTKAAVVQISQSPTSLSFTSLSLTLIQFMSETETLYSYMKHLSSKVDHVQQAKPEKNKTLSAAACLNQTLNHMLVELQDCVTLKFQWVSQSSASQKQSKKKKKNWMRTDLVHKKRKEKICLWAWMNYEPLCWWGREAGNSFCWLSQ